MAFVDMGHAILPMHDSFIVHHGREADLQEQMDMAFEEVMGTKCHVDLKYNSIDERHKRHGGESRELGDVSLEDLMRRSHSIYEDLLIEYRRCEDMEYKRKLQSFRDRGFDPFDDEFATIDRILNDDDEPDEHVPF